MIEAMWIMATVLCDFIASFKTKGNLTKHRKSKAHYKKCMELGIVPVPTVVDDSYIDEECLMRQVSSLPVETVMCPLFLISMRILSIK
jgi:hypothetical protein